MKKANSYHPFFLFQSPFDSFWLIRNLKRLNEFVPYVHFELEAINSTLTTVIPGCYTVWWKLIPSLFEKVISSNSCLHWWFIYVLSEFYKMDFNIKHVKVLHFLGFTHFILKNQLLLLLDVWSTLIVQ